MGVYPIGNLKEIRKAKYKRTNDMVDYGITYEKDEFYLRIYRDKSHSRIEKSGYILI